MTHRLMYLLVSASTTLLATLLLIPHPGAAQADRPPGAALQEHRVTGPRGVRPVQSHQRLDRRPL
jgi:hypothetical protein